MVSRRLSQEINYQYRWPRKLAGQLRAGKTARRRPEAIERHIAELEQRQTRRMAEFDREEHLRPLPPAVASLALVVPQGLLDRLAGTRDKPRRPLHAGHQAHRDAGGRAPWPRPSGRWAGNRRSSRTTTPASTSGPGTRRPGHTVFIEVKGRVTGARGLHSDQNRGRARQERRPLPARPGRVGSAEDAGSAAEEVRYVTAPFDGIDIADGLQPALGHPRLGRVLATRRCAR